MAPTGDMTNVAPGHGGIERDPQTLGSHAFLSDGHRMLQDCLNLLVETESRSGSDTLHVYVTVSAGHVGHRVPTGFIDRHLILVVEAFDAANKSLKLIAGPKLPQAAGKYPKAEDDLGG